MRVSSWLGLTMCVVTLSGATAWAQQSAGTRFNEVTVSAQATGEELSAQPELWVMEVRFRPMRQIVVDVTDPKTGQKSPKYVWYIAYRATNRKLASLAVENAPVNELDPPVIPPQFIPEFTLVTTDGEEPREYRDQVIPEALAVIQQRERLPLKTSVSAVSDLPPATEPKSPDETVITGVAMWTGIDPEADRYTVFFTGFSNGFKKVAGPDGTEVVQMKTIQTKYWRPGDRFEQKEPEIRLDGQPLWIHR